jgi:hypothetical protein
LQVEDFVFANHNQHMPAYKQEEKICSLRHL